MSIRLMFSVKSSAGQRTSATSNLSTLSSVVGFALKRPHGEGINMKMGLKLCIFKFSKYTSIQNPVESYGGTTLLHQG